MESRIDTNGEKAIRLLYEELMEGWNEGNGFAFARPFATNADLVGFDGTHLKGQDHIASFHQYLFDTYVKGSRLVGKVKDIRLLNSDVGLMHAIGGTIMAGDQDIDPGRNSIQTLVVTKDNGNWNIEAFQNTRIQYSGRPKDLETLTDELRKEI